MARPRTRHTSLVVGPIQYADACEAPWKQVLDALLEDKYSEGRGVFLSTHDPASAPHSQLTSGLPKYCKHVAHAIALIPLTPVRHPGPAECRIEPYYTSHIFTPPPEEPRALAEDRSHHMVKSLFDFSGAAPRIYEPSEIGKWADALEGDKSIDTMLARFREEAPRQGRRVGSLTPMGTGLEIHVPPNPTRPP